MFSIKKLVTSADIFGQGVELKINNQYKTKTCIGGIFTLLMVFLLLAMFYFSGQDLFYKINPKVSIEQISLLNTPNITLNKWTMPVGVYISGDSDAMIIPEYFKIKASRFYGPIHEKLTQENIMLDYCKREAFPRIDKENFDSLDLNYSYCVEDKNFTIFGSWVEPEISYLKLSIHICINETQSDNCAPLEEIINFIQNQQIFFNLYFMNSAINAQNGTEPLMHYIMTNYNRIKVNSTKSSTIYIKEQSLISDDGLIIANTIVNNSYSYDYSSFDDFNDNLYELVSFEIYSSNNKVLYKRSYKKIQDVLSDVGGFANIVRIAFSACCMFFSEIRRNEIVLNTIFEYDIIKNNNKEEKFELKKSRTSQLFEIPKLKNVDHVFDSQHNLSQKNITSNNNFKIEENLQSKPHSFNNKNKEIQMVEIPNLDSNDKLQYKYPNNSARLKKPTLFETFSQQQKKDAKQILEFINSSYKKHQLKFSAFEIVRIFLCCQCCLNPYLKYKKNLYYKSNFAVDELLDVSNMVKRFEELERLKFVFFDEKQIALFNFISKECISLDEDKIKNDELSKFKKFSRDGEHLANIIIEFQEKISNDEIKEIDRKLLSLVSDEFKK